MALVDTSLESWQQTIPVLGEKQRQVYQQIQLNPDGLTCREIEVLTGLTHQSASARIKELRNQNLIRIVGISHDTATNRNVWRYRIT